MNQNKKIFLIKAIIACTFIIIAYSSIAYPQEAQKGWSKDSKIIFAIEENHQWGLIIDPIARIQNGKLEALPEEIYDDRINTNLLKSFTNNFYAKGMEYSLLGNNIKNDILHVIEPKEISGCFSVTALVEFAEKGVSANSIIGLVSNSKEFGDNLFVRKTPTTEENKSAFAIANNYYSKNKGVPEETLALINPLRITVYSDNANNKLLICTFDILTNPMIDGYPAEVHKTFFYIIEYQNDEIISKHAWYNEGYDANVASQKLIDIIDIDGDGFPEVVTKRQYSEHWIYVILKRQAGKWLEVFKGSGGGC